MINLINFKPLPAEQCKSLTDEQIFPLAVEDWTAVLSRLWTVFGKTPTANELRAYRENLGDIPIGLLEQAIEHLSLNHIYGFPRIADVKQAVMAELRKLGIREGSLLGALRQWYEVAP